MIVTTRTTFNDVIESKKIELFFQHMCGCKLGTGGNPCSNYLRSDKVQNIRSSLQEANNSEKDMAILVISFRRDCHSIGWMKSVTKRTILTSCNLDRKCAVLFIHL